MEDAGAIFTDGKEKVMRDPERLNDFYEELKQIHKQNFPDWRFGQFMNNFFRWLSYSKHHDGFYPEEDEMLELLREYAAGGK